MKEVVMVGYAWSKESVNWNTEAEIWIMNDMYDIAPRFDRLFDIHDDDSINNRITRREGLNHLEALKKLDKPIYMQRQWPEIPNSVKYPLDEISQKFHIPAMGDKLFMTCSVSYMIALAIYEGFEKISLYGIDQAIDDEYVIELPGVLYWLGIAQGKGIEIFVTEHSPLLKCYFMYGYESKQKKQYASFLESEIRRIDNLRETAIRKQEFYMAEENKCVGAATILEHIKKLTTQI